MIALAIPVAAIALALLAAAQEARARHWGAAAKLAGVALVLFAVCVVLGALIVNADAQAPPAPPAEQPATTPGCIRIAPPAGVYVDLRNDLEPETISHLEDAIAAGEPRILHLDRAHADEHRKAALAHRHKVAGKDLDEYPPAFSLEGGAGADVRPIDPTDNRRAGARMGAALRAFCDGQAFILEP